MIRFFKSYKLFLYHVFFIGILGCKEKEPVSELVETSIKTKSITEKDIDAIDFTEYVMSDRSEKSTQNWIKFQGLQNQIEILKKGDLSFFEDDKEILKGLLTELKNDLPEDLNDPSILARIIALETSAYKLHDEAVFNRANKEDLLEAIKELLVAHSHLIFQLNKKFEKEVHDIQKPY